MPHPSSRGARRVIAAAAAVLLFSLSVAYAPQVIRIVTNKGVLVVQTDAADIEVTVKKDGVVIADPSSQRRFVLTAGENYELEIKELPDGVHVFSRQFALTRGGRQIINVQWELASSKQPAKTDPIPDIAQSKDTEGTLDDPHRKLAEWVLGKGGAIILNEAVTGAETEVNVMEKLPAGLFTVRTIRLDNQTQIGDAELAELGRSVAPFRCTNLD